MSKKEKVPYFNPNRWREQKLKVMVNAAMKEKNAAFLEEHRNDTGEQLLNYLRTCARKLGHTPHPREIYGSCLLIQHFRSWENAVSVAGLTKPVHQISREQCRIYTDELRIQERMFKENREKDRAARKAANQEKAELAHAEKQARLERDTRWGEANGHMTDEELLTYLCECAETLGHVPYSNEVVGGRYISQRFGGWGVAIYRAGLPELKGVKGPTAAEKAAIRAELIKMSTGVSLAAYTIK